MARLSLSLADLDDAYDIVVVGSGYGGAIAASRLARAGRSVCVLERGSELQPGEYPDTLAEASTQMQVDTPAGRIGPATGLYDFRVNQDINVFVGCGLGGTSLVNANVSLEADPRVMQDPCWPAEVRADLGTRMADGYRRAKAMLGAAPYPHDAPSLSKLAAHERSSQRFAAFYRPPINVTFQRSTNHAGVQQEACNGCGDCVTGCNVGAKNTVLMNYLPDARNFGARIFTQATVRYVERRGKEWLVHFTAVGAQQDRFTAATQTVRASVVVLAAGTLGSTEILLRSRQEGLTVSDALGRRFTGNGDVLAFAYNNDVAVNGVGFGNQPAAGRQPVGPCITSVIDLRDTAAVDDGMVIEEGSLPGLLAPILPLALATAAQTLGRDTDGGVWDAIRERQRELESLALGAYRGALAATQTYLVMAHDDANGRMVLEGDRLRIHWPTVGSQPVFERANANLGKATEPLGGTLVPNPIWSELLQHRLVTVHPLGGCAMAASAATGVVDHKCRVFAATQGTEVHEGLYVSDGAVVPRSLGVNPLLTICALAERMCVLLAADRGWTIDFDKPSVPPLPAPASTTAVGVQFTETMRGAFSRMEMTDFEAGHARGMQDGSTIEFTLTVVVNDLDTMIASPGHDARMFGTVRAPSLSAEPMTVTEGHFQLLVVDPTEVNARRMTYRMVLTDVDGRRYRFEGFKRVRSEAAGVDAWDDTTTLFITLWDGADPGAAVLGKGVLRIAPADFAVQLTTIRVLRAPSAAARLRALARFGRFFAGTMFDTYGSLVARPSVFDPAAPPRQKRPLRTHPPEVHMVRTADGVDLRLTRYRGGPKGPVMLVHGLGVSARIFSTDTIETNLVEFLFAHGYDVWNLDFRASIDLPAAKTRFTGDDVAAHDYPAAIAVIREATGADTVQAVVHCFGATTFFMSLLRGLPGVRSLVASQMGVHVKPPFATRLKTGLYTPEFLAELGVDELSAYVDANARWQDRLFDAALRLYPVAFDELCSSPVCRRIAFLYGPLYRHAQLDESIHSTMHELFGVANIDSFQHLGLLCRTGHLVDAKGEETYVTGANWHNLDLPIAFVHGARNECFLPLSTQLTFDELCRRFDPGKFTRHVIADYGHIDCVFGKNAARDVFPLIVAHLDKMN
jgi:cholesterol oxidase